VFLRLPLLQLLQSILIIREPIAGSLLYGNNIITAVVVPNSNAVGLHFYPIWDAASMDEWLYNGGAYQMIATHYVPALCCHMGREWELSYCLGMRPWIAVAYSAPLAADVLNRANLGFEVIHEHNAHNFPLDLAGGESMPVAIKAPGVVA
jgi:hypothetical protein